MKTKIAIENHLSSIPFALAAAILLVVTACGGGGSTPAIPPAASPGFTPNAITLKEVPGTSLKELVDERLVFTDSAGIEWAAPQGTLTDGASVPRLALWVTDGRFDGTFLKAAVIHDAYCQAENAGRCPQQYRTKPWKAVHRMFYEACLAGGTPPTRARIMFAAVWLGGPRWNDPEHDLSEAPEEALIAEFEACKKWIEKNDPTRAEIEAWMDKREGDLLAGR